MVRVWIAAALIVPHALAAPAERSPGQPWLGVWLSEVVDGGVQVATVWPGGPAARSGLQPGDLLIEAQGQTIQDEEDLGRALRQHRPGETIRLAILRGPEEMAIEVRLGERPREAPIVEPTTEIPLPVGPSTRLAPRVGAPYEALGVVVTEITPALRRHFGAPEDSGSLVTRVEPGRIGDRAGVKVGDVILRIDGGATRTPNRDTLESLWAGGPVTLEVVRGGERRTLQASAPRAAQGPGDGAARKARRRAVALEIERLERRLEELRQELEEQDAEP